MTDPSESCPYCGSWRHRPWWRRLLAMPRRAWRCFVKPPFWMMNYTNASHHGTLNEWGGESGSCSLLADIDDIEAARSEAREYVKRTAITSGSFVIEIYQQPWWLRVRSPSRLLAWLRGGGNKRKD